MKKIFLKSYMLVAALSVASVASAVDWAAANIALNKPVSASSNETTAKLSNDGIESTRWEAKAGGDQYIVDEWWKVDLEEPKTFNSVNILWEGAYAASFTIEVSSNDIDWKEVAKVEDQTLAGFPYAQDLAIGTQTAQYVRISMTKRGYAGYGPSFYEFRVYTKETQILTSLTAAANITKVGTDLALTPKDQYGSAINEGVTYTVAPAERGTVENGVFKAASIGNATITATAGEATASVSVFCYAGDNVALSTNIATDNKVIAQSDFAPAGTDAFHAVDGNEGSAWQGSATNGTVDTDEARTFDAWFVVDLGAFYDVNLVTIMFEGACSQEYHLDFSADNKEWKLAYNYVGAAGVNGHTDMLYGDNLANNTSVRFVRFWSTKAATGWGMKIFELKVFATPGQAPADDEKPVMQSASLLSTSPYSAVIAVEATDNMGVAKYNVKDAANDFNASFAANDGKITVTGLKTNTTYNLAITAVDLAGNESAEAKTVQVQTPVYNPEPIVAAPVPDKQSAAVMSIYSDAYTPAFASLDSYNEGWWNNPSLEENNIEDDHYLRYFGSMNGMIGWQFSTIDVTGMEYLHVDIWPSVTGTITMGPTDSSIVGNNVVSVTLSVEQEKWNSFDIPVATDLAKLVLDKVFQNQFTNYSAQTEFSVDNVYFWTKNPTSSLDRVESEAAVIKTIINGQLVIIRDGVRYNALGQVIE